MKRSEMLQLMVNTWKDYLINLKSPDEAGVKKAMDYVLSSIEKVGMLPPADSKSKEFYAKAWGYKSYKDLEIDHNRDGIDVYENWFNIWEDEL